MTCNRASYFATRCCGYESLHYLHLFLCPHTCNQNCLESWSVPWLDCACSGLDSAVSPDWTLWMFGWRFYPWGAFTFLDVFWPLNHHLPTRPLLQTLVPSCILNPLRSHFPLKFPEKRKSFELWADQHYLLSWFPRSQSFALKLLHLLTQHLLS